MFPRLAATSTLVATERVQRARAGYSRDIMTMPDTGPERPGGMTSDTRQMAEDDLHQALDGKGPRGHILFLIGAAVVIGVLLLLLLR